MTPLHQKNRRLGLAVLVLVAAMVGLSFAAVPLYRLFCSVTGVGGPAQIKAAAGAPTQILDRTLEIRFNADVDSRLPWGFRPLDPPITLRVGEQGMTAFEAVNKGNAPLTGTAIYNVLPEKAAKYFHKIQCFCFGEQHLSPSQSINMPVVFYIDPEFDADPNMRDVRSMTLSYIFYRAESPELDAAMAEETAGPVAPPFKND